MCDVFPTQFLIKQQFFYLLEVCRVLEVLTLILISFLILEKEIFLIDWMQPWARSFGFQAMDLPKKLRAQKLKFEIFSTANLMFTRNNHLLASIINVVLYQTCSLLIPVPPPNIVWHGRYIHSILGPSPQHWP